VRDQIFAFGSAHFLREFAAGIATQYFLFKPGSASLTPRRMTENQIEPAGGIRGTRRWRYLIDIVVLVAVTFLLDAVAGAFIPAPISLQRGLFVFDAIGKMLLVGVAWGLIRLRGETLVDIVVLVAVTFLLDVVAGAFIPAPMSFRGDYLCSTRLGKCYWSELRGD
jgi:hypothetical protein